jgi:hypothetical protein
LSHHLIQPRTLDVPGAKLLLLPAVHLSNVEYPAELLKAVIDFLLEVHST